MANAVFLSYVSLLLLTAGVLKAASIPEDWIQAVKEHKAVFADDDNDKNIEGAIMGNGYFSNDAKGVRSDSYFISGVFNGLDTSPSHRARIPATMAFSVQNSLTRGTLLHMQEGYFSRRGIVSSANSSLEYELKWYAHRSRKHFYVCELRILNFTGTTSISLIIENNSGQSSGDISFENIETGEKNLMLMQCGTTKSPEVEGGNRTYLCVAFSNSTTPIEISAKDVGSMRPFVTAVYTSLDDERENSYERLYSLEEILKKSIIENRIREKTKELWNVGYNSLISNSGEFQREHVLAWEQLWTCGVEVSGRDDVSIALKASFFAILSSVRDDWPYGMAPGGITNAYNGHSFWDVETWMYPSLLLHYPSIAKSLIRYRFDRLPGAFEKARSYSPPFAGAMFPWESAFTGVETCPSGFGTGLREQHISADIAIAVYQYYLFTKDLDWLRSTGWPILEGVSEFLSSKIVYEDNRMFVNLARRPSSALKRMLRRLSQDPKRQAHIKDVIGPDEFHDHVKDSVFTNYGAKLALNYTLQAADLLGINLGDRNYASLRDDLVILFDEQKQIHPEFLGYSGSQVKQADVVLLHYPLKMEMPKQVIASDLLYYESKTDPQGPAMTWAIFAINSLDIGNYGQADVYFNASFQQNIHPPYMTWTETPSGGAAKFITGAGGFLQTMSFGFSGIRVDEKGLEFSPLCPEAVETVKLKGLHYAGVKMDITYMCKTGQRYPLEIQINILERPGPSWLNKIMLEVLDDKTVKEITEESLILKPIKQIKLKFLVSGKDKGNSV